MQARLVLSASLLTFGLAIAGLGAATAATESSERLTRLNLAETELSAQQAQNLNQLSRLLSVLEQIRRDPPPALLVSPEDAKDAVRAAILVKAMTPELQRRAQAYAGDATEMLRQRRLAAVQSEALFTTESLAADNAPEPEGELALRGSTGPAIGGPITAPETLLAPVSGPVTRPFGAAVAGGGQANGLTLAAPRGGRVGSPGAGVVQYVGPVKGWGVILILRLAGGYHLVLAGLDRSSVTVGQSVAPGQPVGWMPDGRQSSSDLYLEVREQGAPVNPARWLKTNTG